LSKRQKIIVMKKILFNVFAFSLLFLGTASMMQAQTPFFKAQQQVDKTDPQARKVLEKLKNKYSKYKALQAEYTLIIDNRETKEEQEGKITQMGDNFYVNNNGNEIYCDGVTLWMYMKSNNEVQINEYEPEDEDMMSPSKILKIYEAEDEFTYVVTNEDSRKYDIEFKPKDKEADFFKLRVEIDKAKSTVTYVKVFAKDGTIYTLNIKSITEANPSASTFKFNKAKYPGVKEVDMR
jgi:outer membrane lipoprotein carrier protein